MRLIDADALTKVAGKLWNEMPDGEELSKELMKAINHAPTIEAEPVRHGRWIKMTGMMPPEYHGHYQCSECQWHMKGVRSSWTREEELTYCPNCGARMDGEA